MSSLDVAREAFAKQVVQLRTFADERQGWRICEPFSSALFLIHAERLFEYVMPGVDVTLTLQPRMNDRAPWVAALTVEPSKDTEQETGSFDFVESWLSGWEKILSLPMQLQECRNRRSAQRMVEQTPVSTIRKLTSLLEMKGDLSRRQQALVDEFGPKSRASRWFA